MVGPHTVGAKDLLPGPLAPLGRLLASDLAGFRFPLPLPVAVPTLPMQLVHEEDVGRALLQCVVAAGPPGPYNIAADGIITPADIARELGLIALPLPSGPVRAVARALAALPVLPAFAEWSEAATRPAIMDTSRARKKLGWTPRFTALEALQDTLRHPAAPAG